MRALALEKINSFDPECFKIYAYGSRDIDGNFWNVEVIEFNNRTQSLSHTNPRGCSVINAELKAVEMALNCSNKSIRSKTVFFVDSMIALQALQKCYTSSKSILRDIMTCIDLFHKNFSLTFQWIPSHIGLEGNEIANKLAKVAAVPNACIDFDLLKSYQKEEIKGTCHPRSALSPLLHSRQGWCSNWIRIESSWIVMFIKTSNRTH